jgi:LysM repeat protein
LRLLQGVRIKSYVSRLAGVVMLVSMVGLSAVNSAAAQDSPATVVHVVAWGETLSGIALRYNVMVADIVAANDLPQADHIYAGQRLVIPGASAAASTNDAPASQHTVQAGENLFRIGLQYGVSVDALLAANGLADPDEIYAGQQLTIPASGIGNDVLSSQPEAGSVHLVQRGETLSAIGRQYGVSVEALSTANNLLNPSQIYAGQRLVIPGAATAGTPGYTPKESALTHVIQPGETLHAIAAQYGVSSWVLVQVNHLSNPSLLYVGQTLTIPASTALGATGGPGGASTSGKAIVIDVSDQRTYVYENGGLIWTFVASTGMPGSETQRGVFEVQNKLPMAYAATWDLQMPYWLGFYWAGPLQNGIHALPILSNGVRLWEGLLGRPASYGCVILSDNDAKLLYDWAEIGIPVTVRD